VPGVVLQELMESRFATNRSGMVSRPNRMSRLLEELLFVLPEPLVTWIGAQFM
jgi:hypothetical protein